MLSRSTPFHEVCFKRKKKESCKSYQTSLLQETSASRESCVIRSKSRYATVWNFFMWSLSENVSAELGKSPDTINHSPMTFLSSQILPICDVNTDRSTNITRASNIWFFSVGSIFTGKKRRLNRMGTWPWKSWTQIQGHYTIENNSKRTKVVRWLPVVPACASSLPEPGVELAPSRWVSPGDPHHCLDWNT